MSVELAGYRDLFFSEAHEQLASIAAAISKLDHDPGDKSAFHEALRASHTLKGMSATMGYDEITVFAHAFEDLLQSARDQYKDASNSGIPPLFRTLDHLNSIVSRQESGQAPGAGPTEGAEARPDGLTLQRGSYAVVRVGFEQLEELTGRILDLIGSGNRLARAADREPAAEGKWLEHMSLAKRLLAVAWSMQMAPIGQVFDRFPQMLHNLARAEHKEIRVTVEGSDVQVARPLLEELAEPLLHLLRNAVVHGIESLSERLAGGKYPRGTVVLRARQRGDSVTIEVGDDGRGLDTGRILHAAYEQALISEAQCRSLGQADAYELIMVPGFSLSPTITKASGRGVGMDIVRNQVQALGGTMHIRSEPGVGTTFSLELARTNGAIQVEVVRLDDQIFSLPASQIDAREALIGADMKGPHLGEIVTSGRPIRLVDLRPMFSLPPRSAADSYGLIVINNHAGVAARVDEFLGKALWRKEPNGNQPPVPLFDLEQLALS